MKTRLTQYFNYLYIRFIVSINYFKAWTINNPLWLLPLMLIFTTILLFHHYIIDNRILDLEFVNNEMLVILTFFISPLLLQVTYNYFTLTLTSNKVYLPFSSSIKNILDLIINSIFPLFIYLLLSVSSILHIITSGEYYSYIFYVFLILTAFSLGYYLVLLVKIYFTYFILIFILFLTLTTFYANFVISIYYFVLVNLKQTHILYLILFCLLICFLCFFLIFQTNITESTKDFKIINKTFKLNRTISYYLLSYFRDNNILVNLIFGIILFILSFVFEQFRSILVVSSCVLILSNTAYLHMNTFSLKTNIISKAKGVKIILIAHFIFFLFSVILASIVNSVVNNFTFFELFLVPMLVYVFSDIVKAKNDMLVFISLFLSFVIFFMIKYIFQTLDTSLISMIQVLLIILACLQVYYSWYEQDK